MGNVAWFSLNSEEQALYDAIAYAVLESTCETTYPKEELKKYIVNKDPQTPFVVTPNGVVYATDKTNQIAKDALHYAEKSPAFTIKPHHLVGLQCSLNKFHDFTDEDDMCDELFNDLFN